MPIYGQILAGVRVCAVVAYAVAQRFFRNRKCECTYVRIARTGSPTSNRPGYNIGNHDSRETGGSEGNFESCGFRGANYV